MRIFYSIYVKNAGRKRSYKEKSLFYAHKTAVRHTLQHELSVAGEGGNFGTGWQFDHARRTLLAPRGERSTVQGVLQSYLQK